MGKRALIIGGSGQIGRAAAARLLKAGWEVACAQKRPERLPYDLVQAGVEAIGLDRSEPGPFRAAVARGYDAVIDTVAFDDGHARQLMEVEGDVGAFVVISTGSVYADAEGRTLDEAAEGGFPSFPLPIPESQPTVAPGPATYSTRKAALEQALLQEAKTPVTLLRAFAIHGEGSGHSREWWYVKRILDGRRRIPLAHRGESRFHTAATANIAALIEAALARPGTRVLNAADPDAPTTRQIGEAIAAFYGVELEFVLLDGPAKRGVGGSPWSVAGPIVGDVRAAEALGWRPVGTYAETVGAACRSAEARAARGDPFIGYIEALFDYAAEEAILG